jgi:hypothetical protein
MLMGISSFFFMFRAYIALESGLVTPWMLYCLTMLAAAVQPVVIVVLAMVLVGGHISAIP